MHVSLSLRDVQSICKAVKRAALAPDHISSSWQKVESYLVSVDYGHHSWAILIFLMIMILEKPLLALKIATMSPSEDMKNVVILDVVF